MKRNKKLKKIIMGGVGFAMAVVVFFVGSMQSMQDVTADVRVFDRITEEYPYEGDFSLNVLEIVPSNPESSKEMGYFLKKDARKDSPTDVSYGTFHSPIFTSRDDARYPDALYNMRTYGLIRPTGADGSGLYPIYALYNQSGVPVFSNYQTDTCNFAYPQSFVKGVYEMAAGDYNIAEGYSIDDDGRICKIEKREVLSDNGVVSDNNPTYDPETNTITVLVPVEDIDLTALSLPSSPNVKYITQATEPGTGNVKFTRSETVTNKVQYYGLSDQTLFYMKKENSYFYNSDYFKEYVLGSKTKYANKAITYNTVQASAVTVDQVSEADLIYISGKSVDFALKAENDLKADVMLAIYNKEVNDHKAVMMDYACYSANADTNVSKLAILLWRESQSEIKTTYTEAYGDTNSPDTMTSVDFMKGNALKDLKDSMLTGANGNFVTGNVYVYNHHMSDFEEPKSLVDAGDVFANGDFNSIYTASVMQQGFTSVLGYITATNKNSTTGSMLPSVTPAVAIQYILIGDGNPLTIMKNTLNVLEIQPVMSFLFNETRGSEDYGYLDKDGKYKKNRDAFVLNYLSNYYDDKAEYINFTSMTVDEFNGRNDDLVETYDIIYIGSETGNLYYMADKDSAALENGKYDTTKTRKIKVPDYNDNNMDGNVYYNIGDTLKVNRDRLMKFLDADTDQTRYAGRDITKNKLEKLKLYLESESLILVEGDLLAEGKVNPTAVANGEHGRMDNSSNMYELMQYAIGYRFNPDATVADKAYQNASDGGAYKTYPNLVSVADIKNGTIQKAAIEQYVATEKLTLTLLDQPREYSYSHKAGTQVIDPSTVQFMQESTNGTREMKYEFIISSDLDTSGGTSTYTPYLYVDVNNDGKYSKTAENVRDMKIVIKSSGQEAERASNNNYVLYKDVTYEMTRELDETFSGYIKWKISIQSNTYSNSHASAEGSTVVKNKGSDELIKILQITRPSGSTLNLEAQENNVNSLYGKYLDAVPGYNVEIRTMTVTEFETDFDEKWGAYKGTANSKPLKEYALDYFNSVQIVAPSNTSEGLYGADMVVLGFGDDFPSIQSVDAITALQSYMESEKPVLLAHDFIMYWANKDMWGGTHNDGRFLRHNVGMDKYGVTQNIVENTVGSVTVTDLVNAALNPAGANGSAPYNYLHSGTAYTRSGDATKIPLIESTGKAVAYEPGTTRMTVAKETQGLSNSVLMRWGDSTKAWLNSPGAQVKDYHGGANYDIDKMNDGQITSYPYVLPEKFTVNGTHGQYFQLDLEADDDDDGETDVVVWYTLGDVKQVQESGREKYDPWGKNSGGPMPYDGYYIYNKGNVTYTGAGHADMTAGTETEAQLFINTLFAAYNAARVEPSVGFFEEAPGANDRPINSIAIPYDENVTGDNPVDSSVLKDAQGDYRYYFVNPNAVPTTADMGTPVFFRLSDTNFVRGTKYMQIEYYLKAKGEEGASFTLDDNSTKTVEMLNYEGASVPVVNITDVMATYKVENRALAGMMGIGDLSFMQSGVVYGFYLPLSYLNNESQVTLYIKAKTKIYTQSSQTGLESVEEVPGEGIGELTITKADLLDLQ